MRDGDYRRRDPDEPLRVQVVVYDLLPPSRFAQVLNFVGSGVYHSSVQLSIPLGPSDVDAAPYEYAFGGHDSPGVTGVFSIPAGTAAQRMPGLRYYMTVDVGTAFGADWRREFGPQGKPGERGGLSRVKSASSVASGGGTAGNGPFSRSTTALISQAEDPFKDPTSPDLGSPLEEDDGGASDGTEYLTKAERRAWRIIQAMKQDEEWNGTRYRLLEKNCNSFTHELVYRLTGRKAPAWLNRAAWVASSVPCIVPPGWIDDAEEKRPHQPPTAPAPTPRIFPIRLTSNDGSISIAPPRADKMELGGRS
ncbi:hypothetical protein JCM11251_002656 [Rhodosporidiobolus azoricus]